MFFKMYRLETGSRICRRTMRLLMNLRMLFIINEILEKFLPSPKRLTQIYFKQNELVLNEEKKEKTQHPK